MSDNERAWKLWREMDGLDWSSHDQAIVSIIRVYFAHIRANERENIAKLANEAISRLDGEGANEQSRAETPRCDHQVGQARCVLSANHGGPVHSYEYTGESGDEGGATK